MQNLSSHSI
ncbi:hypothetical protein B4U80_11290 [Leptotrombidium deliense]|uniref:Uncharacterized protein n=1 Tax=Leptotrombidium deliense TaxID=299467 RepID=A0A443S1T3_9ACAR|nr:hypothetical protein B4U80_11290 [Leptotrombidium deliense]